MISRCFMSRFGISLKFHPCPYRNQIFRSAISKVAIYSYSINNNTRCDVTSPGDPDTPYTVQPSSDISSSNSSVVQCACLLCLCNHYFSWFMVQFSLSPFFFPLQLLAIVSKTRPTATAGNSKTKLQQLLGKFLPLPAGSQLDPKKRSSVLY
jgi:hypothetical protein